MAVGAAAVTAYDLRQRRHAILRNFPVLGHARYFLEEVGPELRQYIVTSNTEERPFNRDQRRWIYASSKQENNYFAFGTSKDLETSPNYLIIKHAPFPLRSPLPGEPDYDDQYRIPVAKVLGAARGRDQSVPSGVGDQRVGDELRGAVVERDLGVEPGSEDRGLPPQHRRGRDLPTPPAGRRADLAAGQRLLRCPRRRRSTSTSRGSSRPSPPTRFERSRSSSARAPSPASAACCPPRRSPRRSAAIRGVPRDRDCISPAAHPEFHDVDSLLDFVERIADATGLPVGIKSAIGESSLWSELAEAMVSGERGVDFITIDGGEGGTGAGPLVFTDQVALPFKVGFSRVYKEFAERGITDRVVFIGSGKLGFPHESTLAFGLGCDMVNVAREAMMAIGCIQAQRCHTGKCPTGVATQNPWLVHGLDPELKAARLANYVITLRKDLLALSRACGVTHPALISLDHVDVLDDRFGASSARDVFGYEPDWGVPVWPSADSSSSG